MDIALPLLLCFPLGPGRPQGEVDEVPCVIGDRRLAFYDRAKTRWETVQAPWGKAGDGATDTAIHCDGRCFLWGTSAKDSKEIDVFDLRSLTWERILAPPIEARDGFEVAVSGKKVAIWGGREGRRRFVNGAIYDFSKKAWEKIPDAPLEPRDASKVVWVGSHLFVWSGVVFPGPEKVFADGALLDVARGKWRKIRDAPILGRDSAAALALSDTKVLVWGGIVAFGVAEAGPARAQFAAGQVPVADGAIYDVSTDRWEEIPPAPRPRAWVGAVRAGERVFFFFGNEMVKTPTVHSRDCRDVLVLDLRDRKWHLAEAAPIEAGVRPVVAESDGKVFVWAATTESGVSKSLAIFHPLKETWEAASEAPVASIVSRILYR